MFLFLLHIVDRLYAIILKLRNKENLPVPAPPVLIAILLVLILVLVAVNCVQRRKSCKTIVLSFAWKTHLLRFSTNPFICNPETSIVTPQTRLCMRH